MLSMQHIVRLCTLYWLSMEHVLRLPMEHVCNVYDINGTFVKVVHGTNIRLSMKLVYIYKLFMEHVFRLSIQHVYVLFVPIFGPVAFLELKDCINSTLIVLNLLGDKVSWFCTKFSN